MGHGIYVHSMPSDMGLMSSISRLFVLFSNNLSFFNKSLFLCRCYLFLFSLLLYILTISKQRIFSLFMTNAKNVSLALPLSNNWMYRLEILLKASHQNSKLEFPKAHTMAAICCCIWFFSSSKAAIVCSYCSFSALTSSSLYLGDGAGSCATFNFACVSSSAVTAASFSVLN